MVTKLRSSFSGMRRPNVSDVYKRQERNFFTTAGEQVVFGDAMLDYKHTHMPENKNDVSVSYTHLDVYKRQLFVVPLFHFFGQLFYRRGQRPGEQIGREHV